MCFSEALFDKSYLSAKIKLAFTNCCQNRGQAINKADLIEKVAKMSLNLKVNAWAFISILCSIGISIIFWLNRGSRPKAVEGECFPPQIS